MLESLVTAIQQLSPATFVDLIISQFTWLEGLSFALSLAFIFCFIRQSNWGWPFAIASSALYCVVFFQSRLYGDAALQVYFALASAWGWWHWRHGRIDNAPLAPRRMNRRTLVGALCGWALCYALLFFWLTRFTDSDVPHADAFLTAGSVVAQILLIRKFTANWLVWAFVDVLYVGLFVYKQLYLTAVLYIVLAVLAIAGWRVWSRALMSGNSAGAQAA